MVQDNIDLDLKVVDGIEEEDKRYRCSIETMLIKMNHNCGSDDFMEVIDLLTHTCDDNLVNNLAELVDIYWQKEWNNVLSLSCIFWIYFLLGSINTLYLVGNVWFTILLLGYASFLIFLAICQCNVLC